MENSYHLSDFEKSKIVSFMEVGWLNLKITQHLNRQILSSKIELTKMKPRPKPKVNVQENSRILREISQWRISLSKITNDLKLDVSKETIRRILNKCYVYENSKKISIKTGKQNKALTICESS